MTTTTTKIVFNSKLKSVVEKVRREQWHHINTLGDVDFCQVDGEINSNRAVREAFDEEIDNLDFIGTRSYRKPDYFALFMAVICPDLDGIDSWEALIATKDIRPVESIRRARDCSCVCGQHIQDICAMVTDTSGAIVGNCCVMKNLIKSPASHPSLVEKFKQIVKRQRQDKKEAKLEQEREKKRILKEEADEIERVTKLNFKEAFPLKCFECHGYKPAKYDLCFGCSSRKKGHIECKGGCGGFHDKKYSKCFNCNKKKY